MFQILQTLVFWIQFWPLVHEFSFPRKKFDLLKDILGILISHGPMPNNHHILIWAFRLLLNVSRPKATSTPSPLYILWPQIWGHSLLLFEIFANVSSGSQMSCIVNYQSFAVLSEYKVTTQIKEALQLLQPTFLPFKVIGFFFAWKKQPAMNAFLMSV